MSISNRHILTGLLLWLSAGAVAQPLADYDNLLFPIRPGVRNTLSGTMGELRSTHFHTGIDIRTGGVEGLAVLAAADGYISRIKVSGTGYGNALYILHPNGKTTVYAHLKAFRPDLTRYVLDAQYRLQRFEVNLFPEAGRFPVRQGDTLAWSGNSGSSGGPHLHFDLRDENHNLLNPLTYGFKEVVDTRSPTAAAIALVPRHPASRINGRFARQEFKLTSADGQVYRTADTLCALGMLGLELYAWDRMNGTRFRNGINHIRLYLNGLETFGQHIDTWSFSRARSFYQHISYPALLQEGKRYHKLYIDDGNNLGFYEPLPGRGFFTVEEGRYYHVRISLADSYGNTSEVRLVIKGCAHTPPSMKPPPAPLSMTILANTLRIVGDSTYRGALWLRLGADRLRLEPAYTVGNLPVYLWPLQQGLPKEVELGSQRLPTHLAGLVPPGREYRIYHPRAEVLFGKGSLFDTLYCQVAFFPDTLTYGLLALGPREVPLKSSITVLFEPAQPVADPGKTAVYQVIAPGRYSYAAGTWQDHRVVFKTRSLGSFTLLTDSVAPLARPLIVNSEKIVFRLEDKLSGIKKVSATLNGRWLLMARDPKKNLAWAEKHYTTTDLRGKFVLTITDHAGNKTVYSTQIQ